MIFFPANTANSGRVGSSGRPSLAESGVIFGPAPTFVADATLNSTNVAKANASNALGLGFGMVVTQSPGPLRSTRQEYELRPLPIRSITETGLCNKIHVTTCSYPYAVVVVALVYYPALLFLTRNPSHRGDHGSRRRRGTHKYTNKWATEYETKLSMQVQFTIMYPS